MNILEACGFSDERRVPGNQVRHIRKGLMSPGSCGPGVSTGGTSVAEVGTRRQTLERTLERCVPRLRSRSRQGAFIVR